MQRRHFLKQTGLALGALSISSPLYSCISSTSSFDFKISLAQWSLHKAFFKKEIDPLDFPVIAKTAYDISGVEYVNQFFADKAEDQSFLAALNKRAEDNGVQNILIMVDNEGHLAANNKTARDKAVENHYKWVTAAKKLGCHSIRVNLHGEGSSEEWKKASIDGLGKLTEFAANHKMNVIVENHGQHSSNGAWVAEIIKEINNPFCGTLPDFGNFCVRRRDGDLWESPCVEFYDKYKGVEELLPFAKGISAKAFEFDENGNETTIDFYKMFSLVKKSGYTGFVGIEYEGNELSEEQGIRKTKKLLEQVREKLK